MRAGELAQAMGMELLTPELADQELALSGCYLGDLLSNVMAKASAGMLWCTVITNINIIAVASLLSLSGVALLEGNRPETAVLERASGQGIPVFTLEKSAYEAALAYRELEK